MSFYDELKRRNVVKMALLYLVASWLILQVADISVSLLELPQWIGKTVFLLLALGFPLVLIFSWVYEMTPEGLKREKDIDTGRSITPETGHKMNVLIVVMLALAIGGLIADRLMPEATTVAEATVTQEAERTEAAAVMQPDIAISAPDRSIAVLPFVNMSSDAEQDYFSDGLSEELLNLLAKVPELRVAARTSSFSLQGRELQVAEIGQILKVSNVLEGSVRKSGNEVRITAQLIHAEDGYHIWSETYDRNLEDIFAIQDEIAAEVVAQLKIKLLGAVPTVRETDPAAYALFLKARYLGRLGTPEGWTQSVGLYQQALAIDPDYAAAWTGLSGSYINQANKAYLPNSEGYALARDAASRALIIDPDFAAAHARLGLIADLHDRDLEAAAGHFERALALDPTSPEILMAAAGMGMSLGRLDLALGLARAAIARDPLDLTAQRSEGIYYLQAGEFEKAIASFRAALTLSPHSMGTHGLLGRALLLNGEPEAALAAVEQEPTDWRLLELPMIYFALGQREQSDLILAELIETYEREAAVNIAAIHAYRSEPDEAFSWLNKAVAEKDPGLAEIGTDQLFSNLHDDPRWPLFLEGIGRSPSQLAAIEFDVTPPE
jgi:TolB-like protein